MRTSLKQLKPFKKYKINSQYGIEELKRIVYIIMRQLRVNFRREKDVAGGEKAKWICGSGSDGGSDWLRGSAYRAIKARLRELKKSISRKERNLIRSPSLLCLHAPGRKPTNWIPRVERTKQRNVPFRTRASKPANRTEFPSTNKSLVLEEKNKFPHIWVEFQLQREVSRQDC